MANINVVIHTDACISRTGSAGALQYWLGATLSLWIDGDGAAWPQLAVSTRKLVRSVLSPWSWKDQQWARCTDQADNAGVTATDGGPPALLPLPRQPSTIDVSSLSGALDTLLAVKLPDAAAPEAAYSATPSARHMGDAQAEPPWAFRLMHLARAPAPIPHWLGLARVWPLPGAPEAGDPLAVAPLKIVVANPDPMQADVELQLGEAHVFGPDSVTLSVTGSPPGAQGAGSVSYVRASPPPTDMDEPLGLVMGLSRLTDAKAETERNWLGDFGPRLGRALHPWLRLADLLDGFDPTDSPAWPQAAAEAAANATLTFLFADLTTQGPPVSRTLALMAQINPFRPSALEQRFLTEWAAELAAPGSLAATFGRWTSGLLDDAPRSKWGERLYAGYATAAQYQDMRDLLLANQPRPDSFGTDASQAGALVANTTAWLANQRNIESLFANIAPTRAAAPLFGLLAQAAGAGPEDWATIEAQFPTVFAAALAAVIPGFQNATLVTLGKSIWLAAFESPSALESAAESGLALRADSVFLSDAKKLVDPHRLHDGYVLAVRRSKQGLSGVSTATSPAQLAAGLADTGWEAPSICTRADVTAGNVSPIWRSLVTPLPIAFDRGAEVHPTQAEVRNAIATYYGDPLIPASKPDPSVSGQAMQPPSAINLSFAAPTDGGDTPKLAFGQLYQARCAYIAPGGVAPQGWGQPGDPWDTSLLVSTFGAVDTGMIDAAGDPIRTSPKAFVLMRALPPGPPRILKEETDTDGAPLARLLSATDDPEARPLWRERMRDWNEIDRSRLQAAPTCFLDEAGRRTPDSLRFLVRAPGLPLGDNKTGSLAARVWRYWTQRDADEPGDAGARQRLKSVFDAASSTGDLHRDDPAVIYPPRGGQNTGGSFVTLLALGRSGVTQVAERALRFTETEPFTPVVVTRGDKDSALSMDINAGKPAVLHVNIPAGALVALSFRTFVDPGFFGGGTDPRFAIQAIPGADATAPPWSRPTPPAAIDGAVGFAFGESLIVFEALPGDAHMPAGTALWKAISLADNGDEVVANFNPPADDPAFDYVGKVTAFRQPWSWDGGPVVNVGDVYGQPVEAPAGAGRGEAFSTFEGDMFSGRGHAGAQSFGYPSAGAALTQLFSIARASNVGADYLRVRIEAQSRYAALRQQPASARALTLIASDAAGSSRATDAWRAIALPVRRTGPLPTPKPRMAIPLFGAVHASDALSGGFAVLLDAPAYDLVHGAGLAEQMVAEIVVQQLGVQVAAAVSDDVGPTTTPGATLALSVGMDPTFEDGDGSPYEDQTGPQRISLLPNAPEPADLSALAAQFASTIVLGETLEPDSAAPVIPYATAIFEPSLAANGAKLRPGSMALIRLQTRAMPTAPTVVPPPSPPAGPPPDYSSQWSAPLWIQFQPQIAAHDLTETWSLSDDSQLVLQLTANGDASRKLLRRWKVPTSPPAGPGPQGRIGGVGGFVVRDAFDREVLRPRCYLDGVVTERVGAAGPVVELTLSAPLTDAGKMAADTSLVTVFVQLVETQEFPEPGQAIDIPADLAERAAQWMNEADEDSVGRVVALGPRFFKSLAPPKASSATGD